MPRNSLPRGAVPPGHNGLKSMTYAKSAPLQEFTNMDERMTNKLLSVQQQAVNLGKDKWMAKIFLAIATYSKGQLISECLLGV